MNYELSDYERSKLEQEKRWEEMIAAKRKAAIEKRQSIADHNERLADYWFFITSGEVLKTDVGIVKVGKKTKTGIITTYGKTYTIRQLFGAEIAKLIKEKERMRTNGCKW